jgi:transcriptional regulator with XRE-family HTH domain
MQQVTDFAHALGRTVAVLRTDLGLDRTLLAERSEISYSYLAAIETGRKVPSSPVMRRLADALGLRSHELLAAAERRVDGPPAARGDRRAELDALLDGLDDDALGLLVQMAHRLADRS